MLSRSLYRIPLCGAMENDEPFESEDIDHFSEIHLVLAI